MGYEADLKLSYSNVHQRLYPTIVPALPIPLPEVKAVSKEYQILPEDIIPIERKARDLSIDIIVNVVARLEKVEMSDVLSRRRYRSRKNNVMHVRHLIYYLCRRHTLKSSTTIGRKLNKDHSTVICGAKKVAKLMLEDASLRLKIETYDTIFKSHV